MHNLFTPSGVTGMGRATDNFPSPWLDMATAAMPKNHKNALQWSEFIWQSHATYREACTRVISYFLTDVEIRSLDPDQPIGDDEREQWQTLFSETFRILEKLKEYGIDRECYGNTFISIVLPFLRFMACPQCGTQYLLEFMEKDGRFRLKWDASKFQISATCPSCAAKGKPYSGPFRVEDRLKDIQQTIHLKKWNVHEIAVRYDEYSGDTRYIWQIPAAYAQSIRRGDMHKIARVPLGVLRAIRNNEDFLFEPDAIYHMKDSTLSGMDTQGWGLSRTLVNFREVFHTRLLQRCNEVIASDYIIPFRLLTPAPSEGGKTMAGAASHDPLRSTNLGDFSSKMHRIVRQHRKDPASWHVLPYPVQYQTLGGEASQMVGQELLQQARDDLLNAVGVPVQLYQGNLELQTAPVALRLFEATHKHLVGDYNRFLQWVVQHATKLLAMQPVQATLRRVTHADDFEKTMVQLQLMSAQKVSPTTGLRSLGLDYKTEQRQTAEDERYAQQTQSRIQEEMDQSAFGEQVAKGQQAPGQGQDQGGDPAAQQGQGGAQQPPGLGLTSQDVAMGPEQKLEQAQAMAQQLLAMDPTQRNRELRDISDKDPTLHALVTAALRQIRSAARSAGQSMLLGPGAQQQQA